MAGPFTEKFGFKAEIKSPFKAPSCKRSANIIYIIQVCGAKAMYAPSSGLYVLLTLFHVFRKKKLILRQGRYKGESVSQVLTVFYIYISVSILT